MLRLSNVYTPAPLPNNNATCTFWRSAENFTVAGTSSGDMNTWFQWAVSQLHHCDALTPNEERITNGGGMAGVVAVLQAIVISRTEPAHGRNNNGISEIRMLN
jgi:hypothetical protein